MLALASIAVLALSAVSASPVPTRRATAPEGWASNYLESYDVYHERYVALGCSALKAADSSSGSEWDTCCHPLLADESLSSRPSQCIPSAAASSSAASAVAAETSAAQVAAAAKTTAAAAAATTTASSSSSSKSTQTDAYATYFMQNGNPGACGNYNSESSKIAAIPYAWWGTSSGQTSSYCGKYIDITRVSDGAKVTVEVADLCPTCVTDNSLDLSQGAFDSIATESEGMVEITWQWQ